MGGIHASMCPEEALEFIDAVAIGEGESLWPQIVADAEAGGLQRRYLASEFPNLSDAKAPDYSLVRNNRYIYSYFQTTRGCPYDCTFGTVTKINGGCAVKRPGK